MGFDETLELRLGQSYLSNHTRTDTKPVKIHVRPKKINNMFLRHFFLENDAGGRLFIFIFFEWNAKKRCKRVISWKVSTFSMRTSQSTNKMAANDGRPKLTIRDV